MRKLLALLATLLFCSPVQAGDAYGFQFGSPVNQWFQGDSTSADTATTVLGTQNGKNAACFNVNVTAATVAITHVGFRVSAVTGTPAADSYTVCTRPPDISNMLFRIVISLAVTCNPICVPVAAPPPATNQLRSNTTSCTLSSAVACGCNATVCAEPASPIILLSEIITY